MIKVGIIGTGNIGTDLLLKILKTNHLEPIIFAGRRLDSEGIEIAKNRGVNITNKSINYFLENPNCCDIVFDCTNADDAKNNSKIFAEQGIKVIDLTPSKVGVMCIPSINHEVILSNNNVNMITCGGQSAIPMLNLISKYCENLYYVEMVSQISSKSAGMATRINIDSYIHTTESAIKYFTNTQTCKVILNLNPAEPCVDMQTTMFLQIGNVDFNKLVEEIYKKVKELQKYIPHYELVLPPVINDDILILSIKVRGSGDYLPEYAGNLDVINCAAIELTKRI
jgi:acetaldehyde dehydrogenase